ncbi:MAG TPA: hypothetical protein VHT70_03630 [Candidatus Saccharimonadales bacterium]|nr:hypothetical protein [Candidatus Saccharimonadales bacterium]
METNGPGNERPEEFWTNLPEGQGIPEMPHSVEFHDGSSEIEEPGKVQPRPPIYGFGHFRPYIELDDLIEYASPGEIRSATRATTIARGLSDAGLTLVGSTETSPLVLTDDLYEAVHRWVIDSPTGLRGITPENVELLTRLMNDQFPDRPPLHVAYLPAIDGPTPESIPGTTYPIIDRAWLDNDREPTELVSNRSAYWWARDHGSEVPRTQFGKLFNRLAELSSRDFMAERPTDPVASTMVNEHAAYVGAYPSHDTRQYNNPIWGITPEKFKELADDPDMIGRYDVKRSRARYERALSDEGMMQEYAAEVERVQRELRGE